MKITEDIVYAGINDRDIDFFESQYKVANGVSYNSYIIFDEKTVVMDAVDGRKAAEWLKGLAELLGEKKPDYLVVSHVEPDHAGSLKAFMEAYPETTVVGNAKTFVFLQQFFEDFCDGLHKLTVAEGETLSAGRHTLQFFMAPMVHWPETMVTYDQTDKVLFSADGFGKFGAFDTKEEWTSEARRYYINIVGKYGAPVQTLLKKAAALDIQTICPLHGPVLSGNLEQYIEKYDTWSKYEPEESGVAIVYASLHGNTGKAAERLAALLKEKGKQVELFDLYRDDMSEAIAAAYRYDKLVLASATYDGGMCLCMEDFLAHLRSKAYQKRTVALIENGTWAPAAGKCMRQYLEGMKEITIIEQLVSLKSALSKATEQELVQLAEKLL